MLSSPPVPPRPAERSPTDLTVVGIGASAGGLAALRRFFADVPADSGLAFVVVVHLSPDHESHLAELLQRDVSFPVLAVTETVPLEENRVYVIPPNANLEAIDTHLRLTALEERGRDRFPIDHFFRTLARTHDGHAVGIVLTGTGSDGALGVKAIREKGGLTVAQAPDDAEYDGMPMSAIATGLVDLVLPLSEIPAAVLHYTGTKPRLGLAGHESIEDGTERLLQKVFTHIRARTGRDFGRYKRSTILRRIGRRMQLRQVEELPAYLELLREETEVRTLADDLLVTVTSFFRDGEVYAKLASEVVPQIFSGKGPRDEVRAWSVGCATGEEAYSLAMLLLEEAARREAPPRVQVFASDLHDRSLERAREGLYPGAIEADIPEERLRRFFAKESGGYRIGHEVREAVVFASHNLLSDPPFSRLDLIACRNLLIYLERELQAEVLELFHYALRSEGFLVVGGSEGADRSDLFRTFDKALRIYQKRDVATREPRLPVFPAMRPSRAVRPPIEERAQARTAIYGHLHERMAELYAPPSLLVSPDDRVVHLSEHAGRYLRHPGGELATSVFQLVHEELRIDLRMALDLARRQGEPSRSRPISVVLGDLPHSVVLEVRPARDAAQEGFALVVFDERDAELDTALAKTAGDAQAAAAGDRGWERVLEEQLEDFRQRFQSLSEQYERNQEEMRASNEELQSANEELRSTLEELETSKEELQSINEELQTVNQENRHKVDELAQLSGDLQNLFAATDVATLFLDRDLRIVRFTPRLGALFNVRPTDRGRPLSDITHRVGYDELNADAETVLTGLAPIEREVGDSAGRWYLTRVNPYLATSNRIDGVVMTFVDITERKVAENDVREARDYAESIVETLPDPVLVLTSDLRVRSANSAFYEQFKVSPDTTVGRIIYELGNGQWDIPALRLLLENVLPDDKVFLGYEVEHVFEGLGRRLMVLNGRRLDHVQLILLGFQDVTETREAVESLRDADRRKEEFLAMLSHELRNPLGAMAHGLSLLERRASDPAAVAATREMMTRQLGQLVQLVDDLLDVSRISRGTLELRRKRVELAPVLRQALETCRQHLLDRALEVDLAAAEPIAVDADPARLTQVFANLLHNARKFTQSGGRIRMKAERRGSEVVISVEDDGAGIAPERLEEIFDMFVSAEETGEKPRTGLGVGLTLARQLVALHGGSVEARSEGRGRGSEFVVRLPVADREPNAPQPGPEGAVDRPVSGLRILVVDDNEDGAASLAMLLGIDGNEVRTALDGEQALLAAEEFRPDVVLLDIGLPKLDGYAVARRLRAQPGGEKMMLVAITGWGQEGDRRRSREAGINHHLVKPVDRQALSRVLADQHPRRSPGPSQRQ